MKGVWGRKSPSVSLLILYQRGNVLLEHEDEEYILFNVKSGKEDYPVEYEKDEEDPEPGSAESVGYIRGVLATLQS